MENQNMKHSKDWDSFKNSLNLTSEELEEINFKVELMGKLVQIRKDLGLTQEEFAQKCNIRQEYLARIERSKTAPQIDTLLKILIPLGYKLDIVPLR